MTHRKTEAREKEISAQRNRGEVSRDIFKPKNQGQRKQSKYFQRGQGKAHTRSTKPNSKSLGPPRTNKQIVQKSQC